MICCIWVYGYLIEFDNKICIWILVKMNYRNSYEFNVGRCWNCEKWGGIVVNFELILVVL